MCVEVFKKGAVVLKRAQLHSRSAQYYLRKAESYSRSAQYHIQEVHSIM